MNKFGSQKATYLVVANGIHVGSVAILEYFVPGTEAPRRRHSQDPRIRWRSLSRHDHVHLDPFSLPKLK